ncbi:TadG [Vibrio sp. HA2012]|uniref:TadE/TadG family type IV pilus assembly protein n=1 Tax=Vibrio sp. HA2012 TaxID=1971595 RepID=UPI000C2B67E2|nr:TadE/TadG family type IV pilus assembly protein [Vibrio sp. HA2012]PJC86089.1 TadG [Vibrio sp. HA2012]
MLRQQGHAAILFVLMVPVLFGMFVLGTDGARAMQDRARLDDALEAASLAIAAHNDSNEESTSGNGSSGGSSDTEESIAGSGSDVNKQIAKAYISQYMTDMDSITAINIERKECNSSSGSTCTYSTSSTNPLFFQYTVNAQTKHDTWFGGDLSFGDNFNVASKSVARKYQNETVDVVFVADFSGSMSENWNNTEKYKGLLKVIKDILDVLDEYNSQLSELNQNINTAALVPFSLGVSTYEQAIAECDNDGHSCDMNNYLIFNEDKTAVNYQATVNGLFTNSGSIIKTWRPEYYYVVVPDAITSVSSLYNTVEYFDPDGNTASFQGVIRAAQVLKNNRNNNKKLMIVLSDGGEYGNYTGNKNWKGKIDTSESNSIAENLYGTYKMCEKIRDTLDADDTDDDGISDVDSKIAVIGFNYNVYSNKGLKYCAGEDNVYKAENFDEIRDQILQLIVEEIGHLK